MKLKLLLLILVSFNLIAQTNILTGNVSGNWSLSGSPYLIQGNILIPDGSTLIIEAGVVVEFQGKFKLFCNGTILANGNPQQSILFTVPNSSTSIGWLGIRFEDTPITNSQSILKYCTFQYGRADQQNNDLGGGIYFKNYSNCNIENCSFLYNYALNGGGAILCKNSSPIIKSSTFDENSSGNGGNCLESENSTSLIDGNIFKKGGIYCYNSDLIIKNNSFKNSNSQGGITCFGDNWNGGKIPQLIISNNIFDNNVNENGAGGGAILLHNALAIIKNNIFKNNSTKFGGGAISLFRNNNLNTLMNSNIVNNLFYNNLSGGVTTGITVGGGAIVCLNSSPKITNNTICNNNTTFLGGAIFCDSNSDPNFYNNIIFNNTKNGSEIDNIYLSDNNSDPNFYYNNLQGGINGINTNGNPYTGVFNNNFNLNPNFVDVTTGNYLLSSNSPCINTGKPDTTGLNIPTIDLVNNQRIFENIIDLGCYESQEILSVEDVNISSKLTLYPNPVKNILNFNTTEIITKIEIYNILGILIYSKIIKDNYVDLSNILVGNYFIKLYSENSTLHAKLYKE
ncbi:MAG: T9SS C-terminal target domain-containing protein [Bacteroidetes bacterium]|nr:MAG: T9SS C-terminal target domain-containing protein [Bacteroidota bacterium]